MRGDTLYGDLKRLLYAMASVFMAIVCVLGGMCVQCYDKVQQSHLEQGFEEGDFIAIELHEDNAASEKLLINACQGKFDELTPFYHDKVKEDGDVFLLPSLRVKGLPDPVYINKYTVESSGKNHLVQRPIYAVFKAPDALGKLHKWIKENGYEEHSKDATMLQKPETKKGMMSSEEMSEVRIDGYYKSHGNLYHWCGGKKVCKVGDEYFAHHVEWLQKIAR